MLLMMSLFHPGVPLLMISFASTGRSVCDVNCAPLGWCKSAVLAVLVMKLCFLIVRLHGGAKSTKQVS